MAAYDDNDEMKVGCDHQALDLAFSFVPLSWVCAVPRQTSENICTSNGIRRPARSRWVGSGHKLTPFTAFVVDVLFSRITVVWRTYDEWTEVDLSLLFSRCFVVYTVVA